MAERALQVATEILIDIAERILALEKAGPAASAAEAIESLVRLQVIQSEQPCRHHPLLSDLRTPTVRERNSH